MSSNIDPPKNLDLSSYTFNPQNSLRNPEKNVEIEQNKNQTIKINENNTNNYQ